MVIVVDIMLLQTISIAIASAGVFLAAIYYIFQIRHQDKMRHLDLFMRLARADCLFSLISEFWQILISVRSTVLDR